jgi:GDP-4-dehydro-6-deoxy-D-mannose reductase
VARVSQEMISSIYEKGYDLNIVMTRSFNHIGPGQTDKFVIASFARQLTSLFKNGQKEATIITGDLSVIRDFVDVRDVVKAYYHLLFEGKKGEIYNICSGKGYSLKEILMQMSDIMGMNITFQTDPKLIRPIENKIIFGSCNKIKSHINWAPEISLEKSLTDILEWWKKN